MHSRMASLQALCLMLVLATSLVGSATPRSGFRLELTHVDSKVNFTKSQLMRRAAHRSRLRAAMLSATRGAGSTSSPWDGRSKTHWSLYEYVVELAIGTPPVPFVAVVDTRSNLIWTQSRPCNRCSYQPTPVYQPRTSRSFSFEPCSSVMCQGTPRFPLQHECINNTRPQRCRYSYQYEYGAYSKGFLGRETLTFAGRWPGTSTSVAGIAFGCGIDNQGDMFNSTGRLGLGRGPQSLVAQLGFGKFSYCLTDYFRTRRKSPLLFGALADLTPGGLGSAAVQSTPLVQLAEDATSYYVTLEGISIDDTRLPIPEGVFDIRNDGSGGVIIDSGTSYTVLDQRAFRVVARHVDELLGMPLSNTTMSLDAPCYKLENGNELPDMPDMVLHFAEGADMRLRRDNYMIVDEEGSEICLGIVGGPGISIIGNFQQQDMHVLYDMTEGYLSFVPADCSKL